MDNQKRQQLISEYLSGKATPEQIKLLEDWFYSFDDSEVEVLTKSPVDKERFKDELFNKITNRIEASDSEVVKVVKVIEWKQIYRWAASILLFLSVTLAVYFYNNSSKVADYQVVSTKEGSKQRRIVLTDGSIVTLNSGSTILYPKLFSGSTREVFLEGEGFFEVAKNPNKPFIIHTGDLKTKVLGTSFDVQAYSEDTVVVTVVSGKVSVNDDYSSVILNPNWQTVYHKNTHELTSSEVNNTEIYQEWTTGKLSFEDKDMAQIAATLENFYDVKIYFSNEKIQKCRLNTRFENESIEQVLELICTYINATYKIDGKKIILSGKGC